ncbi:response regulator transcription factor [Swaminathania salitolerans]|uniref:DNA-binding response regulator n=1 Tax=Swaminathania salitolerans TaxID=182838 RepID=A0A511BN18_9PROT|nr:response regulator [Swaminathania salitolerans]GBQ13804.1 LuxR family transcriptional regulator [Swaminathania salitolerans LMG 21291]GEL01729.1 DNA-binding response regulator [Swaminathania salitolerans]
MDETAPSRPVILVIDDDPASLGLMDRELCRLGYIVRLAASGQTGLDILARGGIDLVLVDACMPGLDGWAVCERITADPLLSRLPVIFMTGLTETRHVLRAFESGAVDYVTKPFNIAEIAARLEIRLGAARRMAFAHAALDRAGRFFFALDRSGKLVWATPQAAELLHDIPDWPGLAETLARSATGATSGGILRRQALASHDLDFRIVGESAPDELLFKVERTVRNPASALQTAFNLSAREAEVLLWIARGKTSRDIAQILGISSRTIDKHTEQIYNKAGFSSRASAAAAAALHLDMRSARSIDT